MREFDIGRRRAGLKLKDMLREMEEAMDRYDLTDDTLKERNCPTRRIGEFQYGIAMIPCDWVYPFLEALDKDERLSGVVKDIEEEME